MTFIRTVFNATTGEETVENVSEIEMAEIFEIERLRLLEIEKINEKEEIEAGLVELARAKLLALGLTEEEAEAIVGPEPKVIDEDVTNLDPVTMEPAPAEPVAETVVEPAVEPVVEDEAAE